MVNKITTIFLTLLGSIAVLLAQTSNNSIINYSIPAPHQLKWRESELGVLFHYDLHVFDNKKYNQTANRINPVEDYNMFNPTELDTDQWVRAAKDAGAKFAVLTATHETGFVMFIVFI
jgi:alpha-L-fucosidase